MLSRVASSIRHWGIALIAYLVSIPAIAAGWHVLAPRAECYFADGKCVWQMDQTSSPYFFADLVFAGLAALAGLTIGWFLAHKLQKSIKAQLVFALFGYLSAYFAAQLGKSWNHVQLLVEPYAIDALTLRSTAMLFVWPMLVQMFVVFRERVQTADENQSQNDSAGEEVIPN